MEHDKIRRIIKDKIDKLQELSEQIDGHFDIDAIHNFRVAAKLLRSFLRLLNTDASNTELKLTKSFKRLYHIAGAMRDAQLELERMTDKQALLPQYMDKLHNQLDLQKKEWHKHYSKKVFHKLDKRLTETDYPAAASGDLLVFFNQRIEEIERLTALRSPSDNQVHSIRKLVKDILNNSKLARKKWKSAYKTIEDMPLGQLNDLADAIGEYNDRRIVLEHLSSFSSRTMTTSEQDTLNEICREETHRLKTEKKTLLNAIRTTLFPEAPLKDEKP